MLKQSSFLMEKDEYPEGFFLVLQVMEDETLCKNYRKFETVPSSTIIRLGKQFQFQVNSQVSRKTVWAEILGTFILFSVICVMVLLVTIFCKVYREKGQGQYKGKK